MRNFQEKKGWRNVMQSKPALMLLGIVVLAFAWSVVGLVGKMRETVKNKTIVEDKIDALPLFHPAEFLANTFLYALFCF